jgi:DNA (cytosine-5)-methyltransferase 1
MIRSGGMFSGSGILELVIHQVWGATPAWFCEHEPPTEANPNPTQAAARLLAHRFPGVPNHGDVARVDWGAVEPVDILGLGFPCTDVSAAGRRAGLRPGTRSGLWSHAAYAIGQLRPKLVVIENVRGLLSTDAHCDVEPCPWCVGDGSSRNLRALGAVLGDLASLGYDARWCGVLASDVGAPHPRFRVFILAWPAADADRRSSGGGPNLARWGPVSGTVAGGGVAADPIHAEHDGGGPAGPAQRGGRVRPGFADGGVAAADPAGPGWGRILSEHVGVHGAAPVQPGQTEPGRRDRSTTDPHGEGLQPRGGMGGPATAPVIGDGAPPITDPEGVGWEQRRTQPAGISGGSGAAQRGDAPAAVLDWGIYTDAIRRWEHVIGRLAPAPTVTGQRGGQRLSPYFVEWMMGWPEGWCTAVPGLSHNDMIRIMGNGIVPQQGYAACHYLASYLVAHAEACL